MSQFWQILSHIVVHSITQQSRRTVIRQSPFHFKSKKQLTTGCIQLKVCVSWQLYNQDPQRVDTAWQVCNQDDIPSMLERARSWAAKTPERNTQFTSPDPNRQNCFVTSRQRCKLDNYSECAQIVANSIHITQHDNFVASGLSGVNWV